MENDYENDSDNGRADFAALAKKISRNTKSAPRDPNAAPSIFDDPERLPASIDGLGPRQLTADALDFLIRRQIISNRSSFDADELEKNASLVRDAYESADYCAKHCPGLKDCKAIGFETRIERLPNKSIRTFRVPCELRILSDKASKNSGGDSSF